MAIKAKVHAVTFGDGNRVLVSALTVTGALKAACDEKVKELRDGATVDLATGEQLYEAGMSGEAIIGHDRYANAVDPRQMVLDELPETAAASA